MMTGVEAEDDSALNHVAMNKDTNFHRDMVSATYALRLEAS